MVETYIGQNEISDYINRYKRERGLAKTQRENTVQQITKQCLSIKEQGAK